jgi:hypothetical protein
MRKPFIAIALGLALSGCGFVNEVWYAGFVPDKIKITKSIAVEGEDGLTEGCGVAAFEIDAGTIARIRIEGLAFFDDARQGHRDDKPTYGPWQATSSKHITDIEGGGGFLCVRDTLPKSLLRTIEQATEKPGSFYAVRHEAMLLVIPDAQMVVFLYYG